jgi:autotransporter-associated beta strand protein
MKPDAQALRFDGAEISMSLAKLRKPIAFPLAIIYDQMKKRTSVILTSPIINCCASPRCPAALLALSAFILALPALAQNLGDFRSITSGNWNSVSTWERYDGANWVAGFFPTNANAGIITIQNGNSVTNAASLTADQIVVAAGGLLAASSTLTLANGSGVDLDVSGTLLALGGSSVFTLQASSEVTIHSGGVFIHNGTSAACINNSGATVTFENGAKFLLQRSGATIPIATWNAGSTCEVNYGTASTSRPSNHGQAFSHFSWNNTNQSGGVDLNNTLTNVAGDLTIDSGLLANFYEFKLNNASGVGNGFYGGNIIINAGRLNWASAGGPYVWTLRGNLVINSGTAMDVSGSASGSYTLLLDSGGVQNYSCGGTNTAVKLNWTINGGTTLNMNDDLPLTAAGRTLTANGIINANGKVLSTDLVAGNGTIRNQGGGNGTFALGAGNGNNTLDGTLALLNGASGTLGLVKRGSGTLTITAAHSFGGGLVVSNGTVLVDNTSGSGTGAGAVTVYGGILGGHGIISGAVSIQSGAAISPGASEGKLRINNSLTLGGNTIIEVNKGAATNDQIVATSVNYGGTLTVTDLGGGLNAGDSFTIFSAGSRTGDFDVIVGSPGPDLAWQFNPTTGVLSVVSVAVNPPTLSYARGGNTLTLSWAEPGFKLQAKTNSLDGNWSDYSGGGSSPVPVPIDSGKVSVFFRLAPQ